MSDLRIDDFLKRLSEGDMEMVAREELAYLQKVYGTTGSQKYALSRYRQALRSIDPQHPAIRLLSIGKTATVELNDSYRTTVATRQRSRRPLDDLDGYILFSESLLNATSYIHQLMGLAALTGRRTGELLTSAIFEDPDTTGALPTVLFTGQLKTKQSDTDRPYRIPLLSTPERVIPALVRLQTRQSDLWGNPEKAKNRVSKPLSAAVKKLYKPYFGEAGIGRDFRRAYTAVAYVLTDERDRVAEQRFASDVLGHGSNDLATGAAYTDFVVTDPAYT